MKIIGKVETDGKIVFPAGLGEALNRKAGDIVMWEINEKDNSCKQLPDYLMEDYNTLAHSFTEWFTPEDDEAFRDLQNL